MEGYLLEFLRSNPEKRFTAREIQSYLNLSKCFHKHIKKGTVNSSLYSLRKKNQIENFIVHGSPPLWGLKKKDCFEASFDASFEASSLSSSGSSTSSLPCMIPPQKDPITPKSITAGTIQACIPNDKLGQVITELQKLGATKIVFSALEEEKGLKSSPTEP